MSGRTRETLVISTAAALEALPKRKRWAFPSHERVSLRLDGLDQADLGDWERKIDRYLRACGCSSGTAALFIGLVAATAWLLLPPRASLGKSLALAILITVAAAIAGKVIGLTYAELQLRLTCRALLSRLRATQAVRPSPRVIGER